MALSKLERFLWFYLDVGVLKSELQCCKVKVTEGTNCKLHVK